MCQVLWQALQLCKENVEKQWENLLRQIHVAILLNVC